MAIVEDEIYNIRIVLERIAEQLEKINKNLDGIIGSIRTINEL